MTAIATQRAGFHQVLLPVVPTDDTHGKVKNSRLTPVLITARGSADCIAARMQAMRDHLRTPQPT